jgi:Zn-dependent protease with chaperone function
MHEAWALFCLFVTWALIGLATLGIGLLFPLAVWAYVLWKNRYLETFLKGNAVRVHERQFPEIYESAARNAKRLGMKTPEIYIMEHNQQNAFALKMWNKRYIILFDDIVFGALATGNPKVIDFIVGHELAHHALGHTGTLRLAMCGTNRTLSRLDELTCDAVSQALVQDAEAARDALCLLLVGPQLFARLDRNVIDEQAQQILRDLRTSAAEKEYNLTHPLLLHRYARIKQQKALPQPAVDSLSSAI